MVHPVLEESEMVITESCVSVAAGEQFPDGGAAEAE